MDRLSLADELSAAFENAGTGAATLAQEFGLELADGQDLVDGEGLDELQFASSSAGLSEHSEDEHAGLFSSSTHPTLGDVDPAFDDSLDPELDPTFSSLSVHDESGRGEADLFGNHRSRRPSSRARLGVAPRSDDINGLSAETPTRPSRSLTDRSRTPSSGRRSRHVSLAMSVDASRTQASSLFDDDRSDSDVDRYFDNEDDRQETSEDEEGPRGVLFSPSTSSATLGTDGGDDLTSLSHAGFVDLLRTDDRSLALEQAASALVAHFDELARKMEGRNRDLDALALDVGRLLAEGRAFAGHDEGDEEEKGWRWSCSPEREQSMDALVEEEDKASSDGEDGEDRWPSTSSPSTPVAFRSSNRQLHHPPSVALPPSASSPSSIWSSLGHAPASNLPPLDLAEMTTPVLVSLGAIRDQAQISLSASGDAGRRVRAIRATLVTLRAEEDALDRATRKVREWEEGRRRGREQVRAVVEREMGGFRIAMDEFEARAALISREHQAFLVRAAS